MLQSIGSGNWKLTIIWNDLRYQRNWVRQSPSGFVCSFYNHPNLSLICLWFPISTIFVSHWKGCFFPKQTKSWFLSEACWPCFWSLFPSSPYTANLKCFLLPLHSDWSWCKRGIVSHVTLQYLCNTNEFWEKCTASIFALRRGCASRQEMSNVVWKFTT